MAYIFIKKIVKNKVQAIANYNLNFWNSHKGVLKTYDAKL